MRLKLNSGHLFGVLVVVILSLTAPATGQVLRDINYSYLYNPVDNYKLNWRIFNLNNEITLYFEIESVDFNTSNDAYTIEWEVRKDISEKSGTPLPAAQIIQSSVQIRSGFVRINSSLAGQVAVAKVYGSMTEKQKSLTLYYKVIPLVSTPAIYQSEFPVLRNYIRQNSAVIMKGFEGKPLVISHYGTDFPAAAPPFSTAQARVQPLLKPDTLYQVNSADPVNFKHKGLSLVQTDTASSSGLAFRVEDDYPKLATIETLAGPMIYLCTKQEHDKLKAAGSDKTQFDKVILSITGSADRARTFMRNYFRRVEQANTYFSSYKEGWKTDRGMTFIICGPPQEVYLVGDREVWEYKNAYYTGRFTFVKSSTIFDPDNYVLIRDKAYADTWYQMIDLWRKARF